LKLKNVLLICTKIKKKYLYRLIYAYTNLTCEKHTLCYFLIFFCKKKFISVVQARQGKGEKSSSCWWFNANIWWGGHALPENPRYIIGDFI